MADARVNVREDEREAFESDMLEGEGHESRANESVQPRPGEAPGSYVGSDAGILVPTERTHATSGQTYEEVRDNEQLGRPRETQLREVQELAPPAVGPVLQNDQIGRQVVSSVLRGETGPEPATPDAANTEGTEDIAT